MQRANKFLSSFVSRLHLRSSLSTSTSQTQESMLYVLKQLDKKPSKALEFFHHVTSSESFKPCSSACNLMLRILAGHQDHVKDFWLFLKSMDSRGHPIDNGTYLTLLSKFKSQKMRAEVLALTQFRAEKDKEAAANEPVRLVSSILQCPDDWSEETAKKLEEVDLGGLSDELVVRVLREIRNKPFKALSFFRWVSGRSPGYKHGSIAYNAMARVLGREESVKEFWLLIAEMKRESFEMDIDSYVKISRNFLKSKMMEDAVKLYEHMMDGPYKPAIQDCGMLLRQISLTDAPDLDLVSRVVDKYEAAGHSLSKVVYDGIHRALTSNGRFDEAEKVTKKMQDAGFQMDNISYSQLVYGLCKAKQFDEACKVLDDMEEVGCVPDLKTWTVLIQGHSLAGEVEKALECLAKMLEKGCEADADLLSILVKGLCNQGRVDGAYTLLTEMVDKFRVRPWQATFKFLIEQLLKERKLEEAMKILRLMKNHKYPPFAEPFQPYIAKFGTIEDAQELLKALSQTTYPSAAAYLHVFTAFFNEGRYTEAQALLFKCPHHIRKHDDITKLFGSVKVAHAA